MCCAIDGKGHQTPLRADGRCMHCGKTPGPEDTMGDPLPMPTAKELAELLDMDEYEVRARLDDYPLV